MDSSSDRHVQMDPWRKLKIPNYMCRVLGDLQKEGRVKKSGRNYTAA
jgi:hypothetical protein